MKKTLKIILIILVIVVLVFLIIKYFTGEGNTEEYSKNTTNFISIEQQNYVEGNLNTLEKENTNSNISNKESTNSNFSNTNERVQEEEKINRSKDKVTITALQDSATSSGITIIITDTNKVSYGWGKGYRIQKKNNNEWKDVKAITNDIYFTSEAYELDENNQYPEKINWTKFYGELPEGTYRIVKQTYDNGYIDFYSDEFHIES